MLNKTLAKKYGVLGEGHIQVINLTSLKNCNILSPINEEKGCELKMTAPALWNSSNFRQRLQFKEKDKEDLQTKIYRQRSLHLVYY